INAARDQSVAVHQLYGRSRQLVPSGLAIGRFWLDARRWRRRSGVHQNRILALSLERNPSDAVGPACSKAQTRDTAQDKKNQNKTNLPPNKTNRPARGWFSKSKQ